MKLRMLRSQKLRVLYRIVGGIAALYLTLGLLVWVGQTRLIFHPEAAIETTPDAVGLTYETVELPMEQGRIQGWWFESDHSDAPTVLYLHGTGSNLGDLVGLAEQIHTLGWAALLIDYRGYGQSPGNFPSEASVYEDAIAALNYLVTVRRIPIQQIVVMGQSIGGAIALELATRYPNLGAVVVESTFTSMPDMVRYLLPLQLLPVDLLLHQRFDSLAKVRSLQVPLLVIHGTGDRVIPARMGQALYEAASSPKVLLLIPQAGHSNVRKINRALYVQTLQKFVQRYVISSS
jgi:uncharacterized protein